MGRSGISVALCTYNGAAFLQRQLDSLASQTLAPEELVACDDASDDESAAMLHGFARHAPFEVRIERNAQRLGVVGNFSRAIGLCRGDYIALCDQDDVWLPGRLARCHEALEAVARRLGRATPALVYSDLALIDAEDRLLADSAAYWRGFRDVHPEPLKELVLQNYATGCSMLFNRALAELALPIPQGAPIHDWWLALIAAGAGEFCALGEALVRYRSHGANAVGAKGREGWVAYGFHPALASRIFRRAITQAEAAASHLAARGFDNAGTRFMREFVALCGRGGFAAAHRLWASGVRMQRPIPMLAFMAHVALLGIRPAAP